MPGIALRDRHLLVALAALAALGALAWVGSSVPPVVEQAEASKRCGTYPNPSTSGRVRVIVIRNVKCKRAKRVARKYDYQFRPPRGWACALAHGPGRVRFSCGKGGTSGDIRDWPKALKTVNA
jgi:hypothetical protein